MKSTTQLEFNITIDEIDDIYAPNYRQMLLNKCREIYLHTCIQQQWICAIHRIVQSSLPNIIRRDLNAKVRVYVIVEADVYRIDNGDMVHEVKLGKIVELKRNASMANTIANTTAVVYGSTDMVSTHISMPKELTHFVKSNDIIPVQITDTKFEYRQSKIKAMATIIQPLEWKPVVYKISTAVIQNIAKYADVMTAVQNALINLQSAPHERVDFFSELLSPVSVLNIQSKQSKTNKASRNIGNVVYISDVIENIQNYHHYYIYLHTADILSAKVVLLDKKELAQFTANIASENMIVNDDYCINILLTTMLKHINNILQLSNTYEHQDMFDHYQYIWDFYGRQKQFLLETISNRV